MYDLTVSFSEGFLKDMHRGDFIDIDSMPGQGPKEYKIIRRYTKNGTTKLFLNEC